MKLSVLLPILVVCYSIPFACIQVEAKELKTGKALGFREEPTDSTFNSQKIKAVCARS
jgi:hypothetical protein